MQRLKKKVDSTLHYKNKNKVYSLIPLNVLMFEYGF